MKIIGLLYNVQRTLSKDIVYEPIPEFNIICDYKDGRFLERTFSHT